MKKILFLTWALLAMTGAGAANRQLSEKSTAMSKLANDTRVFAIDPAIDVQGVRFKNRFGIETIFKTHPLHIDGKGCVLKIVSVSNWPHISICRRILILRKNMQP